MTKRLHYLCDLISFLSTQSHTDANGVASAISDWMTATANARNIKRAIVRRDVIRQNGYSGTGAQMRFAADLYAALNGSPNALFAVLRPADREVIGSRLADPTVVVEAPVEAPEPVEVVETASTPEVEPEAPVEAPEPPVEEPVAPVRTASRIWIEKQIQQQALISRLTAVLSRRDPMADREDIESDVGYWLAEWAERGAFDKVLAEKERVPFSWLVRAIERKGHSARYQKGSEPLTRMRGARTEHEINQRVMLGDSQWVHEETLASGGWSCAPVYDDSDNYVGEEVVDRSSLADERLDEERTNHNVRAFGREVIRARYRGNADRYLRVYEMLLDGATTAEVAEADGCSHVRASALRYRVRTALKESGELISHSEQIISLLRKEGSMDEVMLKEALRTTLPTARLALTFLTNTDRVFSVQGWYRLCQ